MLFRSTLSLSLLLLVTIGHADPGPSMAYGHMMLAKSTYASKCVGKERWTVKTGTDGDADEVDLNQQPTPATIGVLTHKSEPTHKPTKARVPPVETTVFQVSATLVEYALESDRDYHLVLKSGRTRMIAEIPDPACVKAGSPFKGKIAKARSDFEAHFNPTSTFQTANVPVTVIGVGFFDLKHGTPQHGVARNNIELHPVLDIHFDSQ
jgi:hypothetical protein